MIDDEQTARVWAATAHAVLAGEPIPVRFLGEDEAVICETTLPPPRSFEEGYLCWQVSNPRLDEPVRCIGVDVLYPGSDAWARFLWQEPVWIERFVTLDVTLTLGDGPSAKAMHPARLSIGTRASRWVPV